MMTDLKEILIKVDRLKNELDLLGPLDQDMKERLAQKIRLEWNYHSNVIEGNQLDWGETRSLLLYGLTANGKPLKDHLDMKGHNEALKKLEKMADKEIKITENLIKEFHEIIIEDPFKEHPEVVTGKFKRRTNYLYNEQGERIDFTPPDEVPAQLNELINWTNNAIFPPKRKKKKYDTHPLIIAAIFHMRFINIHPFDDGNGRICRILVNIILIQCGFPPLIIKKDDRFTYFRAIQKAREEGEEFLAEFMGNALIDSLELYLKAAKGEAIDEPGDLDKKIALLDQKIKGLTSDEEVKIKKDVNVVIHLFRENFIPLLKEIQSQLAKLTPWFHEHRLLFYFNDNHFEFNTTVDIEKDILSHAFENYHLLNLEIRLSGFKKSGTRAFNVDELVQITLDEWKYTISLHENQRLNEKLYHQKLNEEERKQIAEKIIGRILNKIDNQVETLKNGRA